MSSFFAILLSPLTLLTRLIAGNPLVSLAACTLLTIGALLIGDRVTASCIAMVGGIVLVWYDEGRRPALPAEADSPAA